MHPQLQPIRRDERLLTDLEACEYLRIRNRQLYAWRMQGLIPFIRIGRAIRYRQRDLDAALDALTVGSNQPLAR
ncbi:MAG: helix-turn-helix domain-containing protein [Verrucomicrobiota bacterium]